MVRFLIYWFTVALSLWVASRILSGVHVEDWTALLVASLVLGIVNAVVRPVLVLLTLPVTILTLGLFYLVVNGVAFALASALVPGFEVESFGSAVLGALVVGVTSWFVGTIVRPDRRSAAGSE